MSTSEPAKSSAVSPAVLLTYVRTIVERADRSIERAGTDPAEAEASIEAAERVSEELKWTAGLLERDRALGVRLLSLREALDSHILTARALMSCDIHESAVPTMLRRGLVAVVAGLPDDVRSTRVHAH
jgi:hypothetical protein